LTGSKVSSFRLAGNSTDDRQSTGVVVTAEDSEHLNGVILELEELNMDCFLIWADKMAKERHLSCVHRS
jgi:hypothetical protein